MGSPQPATAPPTDDGGSSPAVRVLPLQRFPGRPPAGQGGAVPPPAGARSLPGRLGEALGRHRTAILVLQWLVVLVYLVLVIAPAFLPLPPAEAHLWDNLRLFAQFAFWGLWWPGVMLATLALGRVWCGVLCPEGALSEWASHFGRGKAVPRWLKWPGWPLFAFVATTLYGQLVSVYEYPQAALLVLGGSTVAAVAVGLLYGRDRRIWCRYLCPASGVFALLAKIAPLHYRVDRAAWDRAEGPQPRVACAPLVDIRRMTSASECHACGRCQGHRGAVTLAARVPGAELLDPRSPAAPVEAATLLFGVLGVATAAFTWSMSPWFVAAKQTLAEWLVARDWYAPLADDVPWWLLTHYPEANDLFTWLDGGLIAAWILGGGALIGLALWLPLRAAAAVARQPWPRLALTMAPLGGISVFLGLSMLTLSHLKAEGVLVPGLGPLRIAGLALGVAWSLWLAYRLVTPLGRTRRGVAIGFMTLASLLPAGLWLIAFFAW